jgi:hypothetical protein
MSVIRTPLWVYCELTSARRITAQKHLRSVTSVKLDATIDTKELLTIITWPVTFPLRIASGLILPRLTRKGQVLTWAIVSEADLIPRELSEALGIPVVLQVGDARPSSLSALTIRVGNSGNEIIKDLTMALVLNAGASILSTCFSTKPGEYARHVRWVSDKAKCRITAAFINPKQNFELEILSSAYESGTAGVDASAPGVEVRKTTAIRWDAVVVKRMKYDPGRAAMSEVADEIRALRKYISRRD